MAKILLLEADRQLAKHIIDYLERQSYEVVWFTDPQTAISATDINPPDLVILNLSLAGRSGIEFLYELRSYPDWQNIPVISTGRLSPEEQAVFSQAFSQLNICRYLPKEDISLSEMAITVRQLLQPART